MICCPASGRLPAVTGRASALQKLLRSPLRRRHAARAALPGDCRIVGFVGASDDPEISFWRPYGDRQVADILPSDSLSQIRDRHIEYALVSEVFLHAQHLAIESWLQAHQAALVTSISVTTEVSVGPSAWYVVRFQP